MYRSVYCNCFIIIRCLSDNVKRGSGDKYIFKYQAICDPSLKFHQHCQQWSRLFILFKYICNLQEKGIQISTHIKTSIVLAICKIWFDKIKHSMPVANININFHMFSIMVFILCLFKLYFLYIMFLSGCKYNSAMSAGYGGYQRFIKLHIITIIIISTNKSFL